ncbi:hypothetical protein CDD83_5766 [Cordyceps sp. RAO-2017]|nr:hypothetical protein CDD83_5766 [Cordyceps sp. RAO-2017]
MVTPIELTAQVRRAVRKPSFCSICPPTATGPDMGLGEGSKQLPGVLPGQETISSTLQPSSLQRTGGWRECGAGPGCSSSLAVNRPVTLSPSLIVHLPSARPASARPLPLPPQRRAGSSDGKDYENDDEWMDSTLASRAFEAHTPRALWFRDHDAESSC